MNIGSEEWSDVWRGRTKTNLQM